MKRCKSPHRSNLVMEELVYVRLMLNPVVSYRAPCSTDQLSHRSRACASVSQSIICECADRDLSVDDQAAEQSRTGGSRMVRPLHGKTAHFK